MPTVKLQGVRKKLRLTQCILDQRLQMRVGGIDESHAADIAEKIKQKKYKNTNENRIHVYDVDGIYYVVDGYDRHEAHKLARQQNIYCYVWKGTWLQARMAAHAANQQHNARMLTPKDKRHNCEELLLTLKEAGERWTQDRISEFCGLHRDTVREIVTAFKAAHATEETLPETGNVPEPTPIVDKAGKQYKSSPGRKPKPVIPGRNDWRDLPYKDVLNLSAEKMENLESRGFETCGQLWDALRKGMTTGLNKRENDESARRLKEMKDQAGDKTGTVKQGQEVFAWGDHDTNFGKVKRSVDALAAKFPELTGGPEINGLHKLLEEFEGAWKALRKRFTK